MKFLFQREVKPKDHNAAQQSCICNLQERLRYSFRWFQCGCQNETEFGTKWTCCNIFETEKYHKSESIHFLLLIYLFALV